MATLAGVIPLKTAFVVGATGVVALLAVVDTLSKTSADPETVPTRLTSALPPLEALETVKVAERSPAAEGVLVIVTVQSTVLSPLSVHVGEPVVMSVTALTSADEVAAVAP